MDDYQNWWDVLNTVQPTTGTQTTAPEWQSLPWFTKTDWNNLSDPQIESLFGSQDDIKAARSADPNFNLRTWYQNNGKNEVLNGSRSPTQSAFGEDGSITAPTAATPTGPQPYFSMPNINWSDPNSVRQNATQMWANVALDPYTHTDLNPQTYSWLGDYTPSQMTAATLGAAPTYSAAQIGSFDPYNTVGYEGYVGDKTFIDTKAQDEARAQQQDQLNQYEWLAKNGLTSDERTAIDKINATAQTARQRADQAVLQDMAERGTLGSGSELAQRLAANQSAANMANQQGGTLEQAMLQRQNDAMNAASALTGQIRGQDQSLAAQQAQLFENFQQRRENIVNQARQYAAGQTNAANAWAANANAQARTADVNAQNRASEFNIQNQQARDLYNTAAENQARSTNTNYLNQAGMYNNAGRQNISGLNTDLANSYVKYNQDHYNNTIGLNNQQKLGVLTNLTNNMQGYAGSLDKQNAANAQQNAANTAMWVSGGAKVLGSALDNADTIKSAVNGASDWLKGLF